MTQAPNLQSYWMEDGPAILASSEILPTLRLQAGRALGCGREPQCPCPCLQWVLGGPCQPGEGGSVPGERGTHLREGSAGCGRGASRETRGVPVSWAVSGDLIAGNLKSSVVLLVGLRGQLFDMRELVSLLSP